MSARLLSIFSGTPYRWVGDNKELGDIRHFFSPNSGNFSVTGHKRHEYDGKEIIAANWTSSTAFQNTSEFPNFAKQVAPLFNQPSIGQYPLENGTWHCLPQDYHMDTAALMPINGSVSISEQFIGEIPKGTFHFAALKPTGNDVRRGLMVAFCHLMCTK